MQFKRPKKNINGVLLLDKPLGFSSNQALQKVKWLYQAAKAGHTGTLDPLATGLLPLCFGEATKFAHYLTDADKTYFATLKLGVTTNTGDAEGEVLSTQPVNVSQALFAEVCRQFVGKISQIPPMYSALKHEGKALYEYARAGVEIERKERFITIHSITQNSFEQDVASITVTCTKGTYIRTLAEDIGQKLGCGAHLIGLRRTATANYQIAQSITLEQFEAMSEAQRIAALLPPDSAVLALPAMTLDEDSTFYLQRGQAVWQSGAIPQGLIRLYSGNQVFLGLGEQQSDGKIAPKRLIVDKDG
ncbi:tRNA pseudouridine(55) synthase TruB [Methylotenera sp.]|uniref:tRNA pseudouridine(55) synthase TruB n=1 Tax=Methylotenera sp. TaxID=2051956 RepID=UPI00271B27A9|nr:tRNA pseudouridine(55) synthase TruB [Methylotenera sp.]MDO9206315.1 tRNA pseudouridine(55) synthase TruB [Methylotenera sp.]MDP1521616.1 tRNA pseudouridine(55) synthase TruB [Methylotenera sp.]MDP3307637.1 tRNA pseudouridine(55) synthase TruB [Methylotenera sp.]MDP3819075.1 tRNA pseudouridine(55) synthase TruB [Methylotenera sp.]MDZ4211521.1 tRNA pseudouridine(55) synthase TruB [Methylotenera sp.]